MTKLLIKYTKEIKILRIFRSPNSYKKKTQHFEPEILNEKSLDHSSIELTGNKPIGGRSKKKSKEIRETLTILISLRMLLLRC